MVRLIKRECAAKAEGVEACYRTGRVFHDNTLITTLTAGDVFVAAAGAAELPVDIAALAAEVDAWRPGA